MRVDKSFLPNFEFYRTTVIGNIKLTDVIFVYSQRNKSFLSIILVIFHF